MFASDASAFLADDGVAVQWTPAAGGQRVDGLMLVDAPDLEIQGGEVQSREYLATLETAAWPGLKRGEVIVLTGRLAGSYKLRADPRAVEDGVFSTAKLTRVQT